MTKSILMEILNLGGLSYTSLKAQWDHEQTRIRAEVETPDSQFLVGRDGHNLQALQFLVNLILNRRLKSNVAVQVDVMGYWKSKEEGIRNQVKRAVEEVRRTGRPHRMEPMDPAFRRLVHRSLVNHPDIETASEGEGPYRKVVLKPRKRS